MRIPKMKLSKTISFAIALAIVVLTIHSCYVDREDRHYRIPYKNNTDRTIYVDFHVYWNWLPPLSYLDTTLPCCDPRKNRVATIVEPNAENPEACFSDSFYESSFGSTRLGFDTLMVFAFDEDTLEFYGWDSVCAHYKVLQRYDLSLEDLQDLDFKLCFPPSEAMKHIHMWPPYGTYDENGNIRIEKQ